jgi:hypothetical protein
MGDRSNKRGVDAEGRKKREGKGSEGGIYTMTGERHLPNRVSKNTHAERASQAKMHRGK